MKKISLMLVDDHQMVLEGLKSLLQHHQDIEIRFACTNGQAAIDYLTQGNPIDMVLLDINLPGMNGFELCKLIKKKFPAIKIIALSTHQERSAVTRMLQNGASGFLSKSVPETSLTGGFASASLPLGVFSSIHFVIRAIWSSVRLRSLAKCE